MSALSFSSIQNSVLCAYLLLGSSLLVGLLLCKELRLLSLGFLSLGGNLVSLQFGGLFLLGLSGSARLCFGRGGLGGVILENALFKYPFACMSSHSQLSGKKRTLLALALSSWALASASFFSAAALVFSSLAAATSLALASAAAYGRSQ